MKIPSVSDLAGLHLSEIGSCVGEGCWTCDCGRPFVWQFKLADGIPFSQETMARETVVWLVAVREEIARHVSSHGAPS